MPPAVAPKPVMQVDSSLRRTHLVPLHPVTGEVWTERFEALNHWASLIPDEDFREQAEAKCRELSNGVTMREQPYVCEFHRALGASAVTDPAKLRHCYGCHPDTWASLPQETKDHFERFDADHSPVTSHQSPP